MSDNKDKVILIILLAVVWFSIGLAVGLNTNGDYKRGQIDALSGKVKYELIENEDMTRTWEETSDE